MSRISRLIGVMSRSLRAFEELLAISGIGAATLEKGKQTLGKTGFPNHSRCAKARWLGGRLGGR